MNFNPIKYFKAERLLKNLGKGIVSAQDAYQNDSRLLKPLDEQIVDQTRGYAQNRFGPVFAAIRLMSETLARAPMYVGKKDEDNPQSQGIWDKDHRLNSFQSVLNRPNPFYSRQTFFETLFTTLLITGNVYCWIRRDNNTPVSLHFADRMGYRIHETTDQLGRVSRTPYYKLSIYREDGNKSYDMEVQGRDVLAIHGPNYNAKSAKSSSPLAHSIQKSLKMYEGSLDYQFKSLAKGIGVKGIVTTKAGDYTPEQLDKLIDRLKELSGVNAGQPWPVIPGDVDVTPINNEAIDQSIFQALDFSVNEVARIYGIPPALIGHNNPTGMGLGNENLNNLFINNALQPYATRIEEAVYSKIMVQTDRSEGYICRLDLSALGGGTLSDKIKNAERGVKSALISPNEARQMFLGLGPIEDGDGLRQIQGAPESPGENAETEERREEERDPGRDVEDE